MKMYQGKAKKPVKFHELGKSLFPVEATVAYEGDRYVFKGEVVIEETIDSYRYKPQVLIVLWGPTKPRKEVRAENDGFSRIEIELPLEEGFRLLYQANNAVKIKR